MTVSMRVHTHTYTHTRLCVFCRHHLCRWYILFDEPFLLIEQLDITFFCLESRKACFQIC